MSMHGLESKGVHLAGFLYGSVELWDELKATIRCRNFGSIKHYIMASQKNYWRSNCICIPRMNMQISRAQYRSIPSSLQLMHNNYVLHWQL